MSFLFAPRRGYGVIPPPRGAARSRRPQTANPPLRFSGKLPARKGRTRLRQFAHPSFPVQEKEPPRQGEHANAVRVPRSAGAEKEPPVRANPLTQFACPGQPVQKIREIPKKFSRPKRQQKRPFSR